MKKQFLSKLALATLAITLCSYSANAQLGNLKNKVKNAANSAVGSNKSSNSSSSSNPAATNSSSSTSSGSNVTIGKDETGDDLVAKGDKAYEAENWKDALAYYEEAENRGYQDGMVKKRMNECRDNMDPEKQKEADNAMNKANDAMAQMEAMKYKLSPVTDQGITNDLHKANVGRIVFSGAEIPKAETSSANFKNSFNLGDDIYSRVYMAKSFTNEGNEIGYISQFTDFVYRMTVAGQKFDLLPETKIDPTGADPKLVDGTWGYPLSMVAEGESKDTWTTYQIAISPKQTDVKDYPSREYRDFWYRMYQLPAGSHKVKLEVVFNIPPDEVNKGTYGTDADQGRKWTTKFGTEKVLALGEFTVNVTEAGKTAAGKKICPTLDWLNYKLIKVPDGFNMVNKTKREGETVLKVVEIHNDWTYIKNGFGIILSRKIGGKALMQNNKTKLCYVVDIEFSQENTSSGGSGYGSTQFTRTGDFENPGSTGFFVKECTQ